MTFLDIGCPKTRANIESHHSFSTDFDNRQVEAVDNCIPQNKDDIVVLGFFNIHQSIG